VTISGEALPRRGEVWWVRVDKRRPAVVVQTDAVREPRVRSFLVVPLTSRLHLEGFPEMYDFIETPRDSGKPPLPTSTTFRKCFDPTFYNVWDCCPPSTCPRSTTVFGSSSIFED